MLHARRLLAYHGEAHGGDPRLRGRGLLEPALRAGPGPLFGPVPHRRPGRTRRPATEPAGVRRRGDVLFSSAERPPALDPAPGPARGAHDRPAFWTILNVDGLAHHAYVFATRRSRLRAGLSRGLRRPATRRPGGGRRRARPPGPGRPARGGRWRARSSAGGPCRSPPCRRAWGAGSRCASSSRSRSWPSCRWRCCRWRCAASWPDRLRKEADDQALERAAVAKKAVEDYAFFQREEAPGSQPVTDAALVWLAGVLKNDLDVFERGRLLASSKRELYTSGLLAPRVSGAVYRALSPGGRSRPSCAPERIGDFSYQVASVPVQLGGPRARHPVPAPGPAPARGGGHGRGPGPHDPPGLGGVLLPWPPSSPSRWPGASRARSSDLTEATRRIARGRPGGAGGRGQPRRAAAPGGGLQPDGGRPRAAAPGPRAEQPAGRLGGDGAAGGPRGEEPAHAHPALGGAPAPGLRRPGRGLRAPPWRPARTRS